jgi:hypothetical protein
MLLHFNNRKVYHWKFYHCKFSHICSDPGTLPEVTHRAEHHRATKLWYIIWKLPVPDRTIAVLSCRCFGNSSVCCKQTFRCPWCACGRQQQECPWSKMVTLFQSAVTDRRTTVSAAAVVAAQRKWCTLRSISRNPSTDCRSWRPDWLHKGTCSRGGNSSSCRPLDVAVGSQRKLCSAQLALRLKWPPS